MVADGDHGLINGASPDLRARLKVHSKVAREWLRQVSDDIVWLRTVQPDTATRVADKGDQEEPNISSISVRDIESLEAKLQTFREGLGQLRAGLTGSSDSSEDGSNKETIKNPAVASPAHLPLKFPPPSSAHVMQPQAPRTMVHASGAGFPSGLSRQRSNDIGQMSMPLLPRFIDMVDGEDLIDGSCRGEAEGGTPRATRRSLKRFSKDLVRMYDNLQVRLDCGTHDVFPRSASPSSSNTFSHGPCSPPRSRTTLNHPPPSSKGCSSPPVSYEWSQAHAMNSRLAWWQ
mmetsp:Transcript_30322/g.66347  ORF Transcript_30322/g.66347 Transcript_30322/m.66347 type:complete len:288 (+) Transcript_30322:68-931(+)